MTTVQIAAIMAAALCLAIAAFQLGLAFGAPWGRAAWGGKHVRRVPDPLRVASAVAVVIWLVGAAIVLARAGVVALPLPHAVSYWGTWALTVVAALGALVNLASSSRYERFGWAPLAVLLAVLSLVVALS